MMVNLKMGADLELEKYEAKLVCMYCESEKIVIY
jgi:hypothetical protein